MQKNSKEEEEAVDSQKETNEPRVEKWSKILVFYVNGIEIKESRVEPEWTLLYYLRNKLGLTGTKLGCAEGGCGACTVMISRYDRKREKIINFSANACLMPICAVHGSAVITVEGLGSTRTKLHPVQERIAKAHGSQCGFCTPGMVMSMYAVLRSNPEPKLENLKSAFDGNLCRCTGYRPIWEGFKTFTKEWEEQKSLQKVTSLQNGTDFEKSICPMGENCCKRAFTSELNQLFDSSSFRPYDSSQELIFPPKLMISSEFDKQYLIIKGKNVTWYRPNTLEELLILKNHFPDAKIVIGNTEIGVEVKFKNCHYSRLINPNGIKELEEIVENDQGLQIGASVTLSDLEDSLKYQIKVKEESKTRIFSSILKMLHKFAGMQIRNVASVGGNIMNSSPISDLNPLFMAAGVELKLASLKSGIRTLRMDHLFMRGYRKNAVAPHEVLVSISVPFSKHNQYFVGYKQARRRDDDITIVNMALNVVFELDSKVSGSKNQPKNVSEPKFQQKSDAGSKNRESVVETKFLHESDAESKNQLKFVIESKFESGLIAESKFRLGSVNKKVITQSECVLQALKVRKMNLVFGGMGPMTIVARRTSGSLIGQQWTREGLEDVYNSLLEELHLPGDAPGGMVLYRKSLALSLFFKAFCFVEQQLRQDFLSEFCEGYSGEGSQEYLEQDLDPWFENCLQTSPKAGLEPCTKKGLEPCPQEGSEPCTKQIFEPCAKEGLEPCPKEGSEPCTKQVLEPCAKEGLEPCPKQSLGTSPEQNFEPSSKQYSETSKQSSKANSTKCLGTSPKQSSTPSSAKCLGTSPKQSSTPSSTKCLGTSPKQCSVPCPKRRLQKTTQDWSKYRESPSEDFIFTDPKSSQYFQIAPKNHSSWDLIGKPVVHSSAIKQATGEALYCDDVQQFKDELHLAFILSTKSHANITKVDPSVALGLEGVVGYFDASDIPRTAEEDRNFYELIARDEPIFASETVFCQGRPIAAIVATDQLTAQKAAKMVKVEYEPLDPIITIEDAIAQESFFPGYPTSIITGNPDQDLKTSDHVLTGEVRIGGQEHFYLETQATLAVPRDGDGLEVFCSTQNPSEVQKLIARLLGLPANKISIRVPRIGGGFGGKDTRAAMVALPVAFIAYRLQKPVRCMLDRAEDMMMTGNRHPFLHKYKIGFDETGLIKVVDVDMFLNAGCTLDVSGAVLDRGMFHFENSYKIPTSRVTGYLCRTNLPSNVAFRGFGGPQSMFLAENMIRDVAEFLNKNVEDLMMLNFYKEGDLTHYNQRLDYCTLDRCWEKCLRSSDFQRRKAEIAEFNRCNRYKKRGIAVVSSKHGIAFAEQFLNQGGALVNVYLDGSVLITHGGVEMGQGLHTKMIQVASRVLKLNLEKIHITETATDKVPNTITTGSSISSDMYGMAVLEACEKIMQRIQPVIDDNPEGPWEKWVQEAFLRRIQLSATGFYKVPEVGYSRETNSGMLYHYFTYGAGCTEVEIDCLTGDHQVLRTDIVMDLGESLNPAIDIGQIEGAFMQGYGLFTLEEIVYSREGSLLSRGPGTYKIPGFSDIPREFNVSLLKGAPNPRAIYSSKAVGEPPLFLASSAFFAIKEAIKSAREDAKLVGRFKLDSPATAEKIRMACEDQFTSRIKADGKLAWNVDP